MSDSDNLTVVKKHAHDRGVVLIIAVIITVSMTIIFTPFLYRLSSSYRSAERSFQSLAAMSLAEAGAERAIWELNHGDISSWDGDEDLRTLTISSSETGNGEIVIQVYNPEESNPEVVAIGKVPLTGSQTVDKTVIVILEKSGESVFDYATFADQGIALNFNATIDSYDSEEGDYGGENVDSDGHIGTNATSYGSITLTSNAEVYGDASSGPGSNPDIAIKTWSGSVIYGEKQALSGAKELTSVSAPEGLPNRGAYIQNGGQAAISSSGQYSYFELNNNSKVTITTDVTLYFTGPVFLNGNSELELAEDVTAKFYLADHYEQNSQSEVNAASKDPSKLLVFGTDGLADMNWNGNSTFYGAVYGPSADMEINSTSEIFGSITARYLQMNSNSQIHYDEALEDTEVSLGSSSLYSVKSWHEKLSD